MPTFLKARLLEAAIPAPPEKKPAAFHVFVSYVGPENSPEQRASTIEQLRAALPLDPRCIPPSEKELREVMEEVQAYNQRNISPWLFVDPDTKDIEGVESIEVRSCYEVARVCAHKWPTTSG